MRTKYDLTKANAVVEEYLAAISDTSQRTGTHGRTWLEFVMQRNGLIPDVRSLALGESHALWYACLLTTKRLREVSRKEIAMRHARSDRTTEMTVRRCLNSKHFLFNNEVSRILREIMGAASEKIGK